LLICGLFSGTFSSLKFVESWEFNELEKIWEVLFGQLPAALMKPQKSCQVTRSSG
jgi:hypothetical protein